LAVTFSKNGSYYCEYNVTDNPSKSYTRTGSYKVLTYTQAVKPENAASAGPDDILGIGTIEETYVRSDTGKQSTRKYTVSVQGDGKLHGYEYSVWTRVE